MRLCAVAPRSLYRALGAEHVRHRREGSEAVLLRRLLSLDYVLDHLAEPWLATETEKGRRADRGGSAGGRAAAPRVSGKAGCPAALLRAQAAPRPRCRTGDVRLRPGRGRDGDRRPHVGRDARRAVGGTARRRARRRGRRRRPGPRALGGGRTGARRLDPCASGYRAPARRGGAGHARRAGRDPLGPGGGRPSRPGRLRRRQWRPGPDAHAGGRQGRGGAGRPAVTSGRTWRSTRVPE